MNMTNKRIILTIIPLAGSYWGISGIKVRNRGNKLRS